MSHFVIVPAEPCHVPMILPGLRNEEKAEIAALGFSERQFELAVMDSLRRSLVARAAFVDGKIACLGGLVGSFLDEELGGWLLTTPLVMKYPTEFIRGVRGELKRIGYGRPVIAHCANFHARGLRFLQTVGFEIGREFDAPITGETFSELRYRMNGS